jgi:hypothetical protein
LRRNGIQYDGVLFGERKYAELVRIVGVERVLLIADDLSEQMLAAKRLGIGVRVLRDQPYNRHFNSNDCWRASSMADIQHEFDLALEERRDAK